MKLNEPRWYVVQTYSGQENAVKKDLERRIDSMGVTDFVFEVMVPEETIIEKKDGKEKEKVVQLYPGYVFVNMIVTDHSWFVIRNTPRVTGFLGSSGSGTKPVPLSKDEINQVLLKIGAISKPKYDLLLGKLVEIIAGPYQGMQGVVSFVDNDQEMVKVDIDFFGRMTPVELDVKEVVER